MLLLLPLLFLVCYSYSYNYNNNDNNNNIYCYSDNNDNNNDHTIHHTDCDCDRVCDLSQLPLALSHLSPSLFSPSSLPSAPSSSSSPSPPAPAPAKLPAPSLPPLPSSSPSPPFPSSTPSMPLESLPHLRHLLVTLASYAAWPLQSQQPLPPLDASAFPPPRCHIEHPQRPFLHLDLNPATLASSSSSSSTSSSTSSPSTSSSAFKFAQFDVDHRTGFAPNTTAGITRLPPAYDFWEDHLASANSSLSLGQDTSTAALARRPSGARWRSDFLSVSLHPAIPPPPDPCFSAFFRVFPRFSAPPPRAPPPAHSPTLQAPVLDTVPLQQDAPLLRRAHHVLAFLVHFYVHSTPPPPPHHPQSPARSIVIPKALAIPLYAVSNALGIAPVLTFADTVLWNFAIIDPSQPLTRTNIRPLTLFTGGADEWSFYGCCAEIELRGVEALRAIADCQDVLLHARQRQFMQQQQQDASIVSVEESLSPADLAKVASCLQSVALVIDDLTTILQSVRSICDPYAFYTAVRPWFRGSDASGPESPQWIFQGVDESDQLELSGPSAGQSSIIHTLDAFLQVDHNAPTGTTDAATSKPPASCPHASRLLQQQKTQEQEQLQLQQPQQQQEQITNSLNGEFMTRMRKYMPGNHQAFLALIDRSSSPSPACSVPSSVRNLAAQYPGQLHEPYNAAVMALKRFRDIHIRIACLYIVTQSRKAAGPGPGGAGSVDTMTMMPSACPMMAKKEREPIRGTGGNELASLLKGCRDATTRALLPHSPSSS